MTVVGKYRMLAKMEINLLQQWLASWLNFVRGFKIHLSCQLKDGLTFRSLDGLTMIGLGWQSQDLLDDPYVSHCSNPNRIYKTIVIGNCVWQESDYTDQTLVHIGLLWSEGQNKIRYIQTINMKPLRAVWIKQQNTNNKCLQMLEKKTTI